MRMQCLHSDVGNDADIRHSAAKQNSRQYSSACFESPESDSFCLRLHLETSLQLLCFQLGCEDDHVGQRTPSSWVDLQVAELEAVLCLHLGRWYNASILLYDAHSELWVQS